MVYILELSLFQDSSPRIPNRTQPSLELFEATCSSSSLEIAPTSRRPFAHDRIPENVFCEHHLDHMCWDMCVQKWFLFLSSFICMSPHPHCTCMPFCFEGNKTPSPTFCMFFFLESWRLGNPFNLSFCHFWWWNGEFSEGTNWNHRTA